MQSPKPSIPRETVPEIGYILEISARLHKWAQLSNDSALMTLIEGQVAQLATYAQRLGQELSHPQCFYDDLRLSEIAKALHTVKTELFQTLALLDYGSAVEKKGDDGALNALFWSLVARNDPTANTRNVRYMADRNQHTLSELYHVLSPRFGPEATSPNWWWGAGTSPKTPPVDLFEGLIPELSAVLDRHYVRFLPRYVHSYTNPFDVPYIVDDSGGRTSGSYGLVRKVKQRHRQEPLAQKSFHNVFSANDRKKVLRELGVMELCFHKNIIELIEAFEVSEEPNIIHIVMAPWAPYTLLQFLREEDTRRQAACPWFEPHLPSSDVCIYRMMNEIADGIRYLHRLSIKHKDIKPDNILLYREQNEHFVPIITDVGISKVFQRRAHTDYFQGSYQYLAPEQLEYKESSLKADIWQLGCCFAMILAVARGGTSALNMLWTAFENTAGDCSCNIAGEHGSFMQTLKSICTPGDPSQEQAYALTCKMLRLDPSTRIDIEAVHMETEQLFHD